MNTMTNLSCYSMKTLFIRYIKEAGALVNPNDIPVNSCMPYLETNAVFGYVALSNLELMIS
jgi:hypothetical protein